MLIGGSLSAWRLCSAIVAAPAFCFSGVDTFGWRLASASSRCAPAPQKPLPRKKRPAHQLTYTALSAEQIEELRTPRYVLGSWRKPKLSAKGCASLRKRMLLAGYDWPFADKTQPHKHVPPAEITRWQRFDRMPRWPAKLAKMQRERKQLISKKLKEIDAIVLKEEKQQEKEKNRIAERLKIGASVLFPEGKWRNRPPGLQ